jgi:hypothetical protein
MYKSTILDIGTRKWVVGFTPRPLYSLVNRPCIRWIGSRVGPRTSLDTVEKRKNCPCWESKSDRAAHSPYLYWLNYTFQENVLKYFPVTFFATYFRNKNLWQSSLLSEHLSPAGWSRVILTTQHFSMKWCALYETCSNTQTIWALYTDWSVIIVVWYVDPLLGNDRGVSKYKTTVAN